MNIVLIRHFQTYGNTQKQYIGTTDEELYRDTNFDAMVQTRQKEICEEMKRLKCSNGRGLYQPIVYVSPMKRCIETAECLFPNVMQTPVPELRECDFGLFEGKNYEELKDVPAYQAWLDSGGTIPFPEGEAHEDFKKRCVSGFEDALSKLIESRTFATETTDVRDAFGQQDLDEKCVVAFVVHGGTIMSIMQAFARKENNNFYDWQVKNGAGYFVRIDDQKWKSGIHQFEEIRAI